MGATTLIVTPSGEYQVEAGISTVERHLKDNADGGVLKYNTPTGRAVFLRQNVLAVLETKSPDEPEE